MRRMLLTLAAVGALAVPGGMALAQDETPEPTEPATTCDRDRDRLQDQSLVQEQAQLRLRLHDGSCDGDCDGDQVRDREQVHLEDGAGLVARDRQGGSGTFGTGWGQS